MHYVNCSGNKLLLRYQGEEYLIQPWEHITLPEQLHAYIVSRKVPLTINYDKYLVDLHQDLISIDEFLQICWMEQYHGIQ